MCSKFSTSLSNITSSPLLPAAEILQRMQNMDAIRTQIGLNYSSKVPSATVIGALGAAKGT